MQTLGLPLFRDCVSDCGRSCNRVDTHGFQTKHKLGNALAGYRFHRGFTCGVWGRGTITPAPVSAGPITPTPTPVATDPCATSAGLRIAFTSGRIADAVDAANLNAEIVKDIGCAANALNSAKRVLFNMTEEGAVTTDSLRAIDWTPHMTPRF